MQQLHLLWRQVQASDTCTSIDTPLQVLFGGFLRHASAGVCTALTPDAQQRGIAT